MLTIRSISRFFVISICLVLLTPHSKALLLGNFIGCNSFGCRLSALENDVAQLKQQVARLGGGGGGQPQIGGSNFRPGSGMMQPFGNMNNMGQQQGQTQQGGQQQSNLQQDGQSQGGQVPNNQRQSVRYSLDYPLGSSNPNYPSITNGQFLRA